MNRRRGVTLTEVLIAIFIMGIGLLAILSLFPLGAAQMAQALRDQRCAEAAANASAMARLIWKQACDENDRLGLNTEGGRYFREKTTANKYPRSPQRFINAMDDPNFDDRQGQPSASPYSGPNAPPAGGFALPAPAFYANGGPAPYRANPSNSTDTWLTPMPDELSRGQPSYPVFVDPIGWESHEAASQPQRQWWLAAPPLVANAVSQAIPQSGKIGYIPRRPLYMKRNNPGQPDDGIWFRLNGGQEPSTTPPITMLSNPFTGKLRVLKQFSLLDDLTFTQAGVPQTSDPSGSNGPNFQVERQGRYTWAYLFRRPVNSPLYANRKVAEVYVVVYHNRSIDTPTAEEAYDAVVENFDPNYATRSNRVAIALTGFNVANNKPRPKVRRGTWVLDATMYDASGTVSPQARFYRVVNVEETTNASGATVFNLELQTPLAFGPGRRVLVVMDQVAEVFLKEKVGQDTPPLPY